MRNLTRSVQQQREHAGRLYILVNYEYTQFKKIQENELEKNHSFLFVTLEEILTWASIVEVH